LYTLSVSTVCWLSTKAAVSLLSSLLGNFRCACATVSSMGSGPKFLNLAKKQK
jgi:hypothetical protein